MADLDNLTRTAREAVDAGPGHHPDRPKQLTSLAFKLHQRYSGKGEMKDLEEAIRIGREGLDGTPREDSSHLQRLLNPNATVFNQQNTHFGFLSDGSK